MSILIILFFTEDWTNANLCFESAEGEGAIDFYIYCIKAYEVKYQYLLKMAKEKGVKVNFSELPNSLYIDTGKDTSCRT
jgi:hypothetical protein